MTAELFRSWLQRFDEEMRQQSRRVILLADNVSSHRVSVELSNVVLQLLPPNTTAYLHPQDAGVISAFKAHYANLQQQHEVERFDELLARIDSSNDTHTTASDSLFMIDILKAMQWTEEAWAAVSSGKIRNCWRYTQILDEDKFELVESFSKLRTGAPTVQQLPI